MQTVLVLLVILLAISTVFFAVRSAFFSRKVRVIDLINNKTRSLMAIFDVKTVRMLSASESLLEIVGIPRNELSKHDPKEVIHPDDLTFVQEAVQKESIDSLRIRIRDARYGWQWFELYGFSMVYEHRRMFCFSYFPINDQMRVSGELDELKKQMSVMLENSLDVVWTLDCQSRQLKLLSSVSHERSGIDDIPAGSIIANQEYFPQEEILDFRENLNRRIQKLSESDKDHDEPQNYYIHVKNRDGSVIRVLTRSTLEKNEIGNYTLYGVSRTAQPE